LIKKKIFVGIFVALIFWGAAFGVSKLILMLETQYHSSWVSTEGTFLKYQYSYDSYGHYHSRDYRMHYTYTVDGTRYYNSDMFTGTHWPPYSDHTQGEMLTIWYSPSKPENGFCYKPTGQIESSLPYIFAWVFFPKVLVKALRRYFGDSNTIKQPTLRR
jgi:hypothetical protein